MYGQPYYQNYYNSQPSYSQQNSQDERIWVQSKASAEAYLLAPNAFVRLWDSSTNRFYEKRADATGRPLQMEVYEYKRITPHLESLEDNSIKLSIEDIDAKFDAITQRLEALENAKKGVKHNDTKSITDNTGV